MKLNLLCHALTSFIVLCGAVAPVARSEPQPTAPTPPIAIPRDVPFPGVIKLSVDATDLAHDVISIHEVVPVAGLVQITLLYPKWVVGNHGPSGPIEKLAGLVIFAGGRRLDWSRDPVDMYAFHVALPAHASTLDVDFQYLSPTSRRDGRVVMSDEIIDLEWHAVLLYPAGHFARQIRIEPVLKLPPGFIAASALAPTAATANTLEYQTTTLETLVDSPVVAGRYVKSIDLDPGAAARVTLNIIADTSDELTLSTSQIAAHRSLVQQAYKLFGSRHYDHYDFLLYLSDTVGGIGFEHHQSSEDGTIGHYFTGWDETPAGRDLLPHEYTHSWNGKFRRPAGLWVPSFEIPMRDDLLWIYEGQTDYWGYVLAARSGILTRQQTLDAIAYIAATYDHRPGRAWRALQDTTNGPILSERKPQSWSSWQRSEDYYAEGVLIWMDADTLIRERSGGKHSLDDFARAFFGIDSGSMVTQTYTLQDVIRALNSVQPYDWRAFFEDRLKEHGPGAPLDGLTRSGYKLTYDAHESDYMRSFEDEKHILDLTFSAGLIVDKDANLTDVLWNGPAFRAGLVKDMQLVAVDGEAYSQENLKEALDRHQRSPAPIELLVKRANQYRTLRLDYHGGLQYAHLQRVGATPSSLDEVLDAR
jgi:predicted metalloprotease with PDZ domain